VAPQAGGCFALQEATQFRDRLTRARAEGEVNLVRKLEADPDWRAAAFLLERGYRERWGRAKGQMRLQGRAR
jgi:hypothetical protein